MSVKFGFQHGTNAAFLGLKTTDYLKSIQYCDENKDNRISLLEQKAFYMKVLKENDATLVCGTSTSCNKIIAPDGYIENDKVLDENGKEVPLKTVNKWLKNYSPKEMK